jgi:hypothetical protein
MGLGNRCERALILIHNMDVGPGLLKGFGNGEANTRAASGHEYGLGHHRMLD